MDRKRRLALLHPSLAVSGGAERAFLWLAEELAGRGHQVTVFTQDYDGGLYGDLARKDYRMIFFPFGRLLEEIPLEDHQPRAEQLAGLLRPFDLINAHNFPACLWAAWAKRSNAQLAPLVWYCEEPFRDLYEKEMQERYRPWQDKPPALPQTLTSKQKLRLFLSRIKRTILGQPIFVPPPAIDKAPLIRQLDKEAVAGLDLILANSAFTARQVAKIYGVPAQTCLLGCPALVLTDGAKQNDAPYFLTVTRLYPIKNLLRAVEAVGQLKQKGRLGDWRYLIAGDGDKDYRQQILALISNLGLSQEIILKDFVSEAKLANLMAGAAFVLCPSLEEPFGLVPLEAASAGRPAIVSNYGGYTETVIDGQTGIFVDSFDSEDIARVISQLCQNKELREKLGQNALANYRQNFTVAKFVDRWESLVFVI